MFGGAFALGAMMGGGGHNSNMLGPLMAVSAMNGMFNILTPQPQPSIHVIHTETHHPCTCNVAASPVPPQTTTPAPPPPPIWSSKPAPVTWDGAAHTARLAALQSKMKVTEEDRRRLHQRMVEDQQAIQELHARELAETMREERAREERREARRLAEERREAEKAAEVARKAAAEAEVRRQHRLAVERTVRLRRDKLARERALKAGGGKSEVKLTSRTYSHRIE